jgi:hypothetical protein
LAASGDATERVAQAEQKIAQLGLAAIEKASADMRTGFTEFEDLQERTVAV